MLSLKRDVCFWMVPPHDGKVRKFRCTLGKMLAAALLVFSFLGFLLFVAGDYARLQLIRTRIHFTLRALAQERDTLANDNSTLRSEMQGLAETTSRAMALEQSVRARLAELDAVLGSTRELGLFEPGGPGKRERNRKAAGLENAAGDELSSGLGGAERDCTGVECGAILSSSADLSDARASISWNASRGGTLLPAIANSRPVDFALLQEIDRKIDLIRALPLGLPGEGHIRSGFGARISPFSKRLKMHEGIDIALPAGSYIYATGDGIVRGVDRSATYGLKIDLDHVSGVVTRYAHLSRAFVSEGERVCKGEAIALVGSTGRSTGPHLHYEVLIHGKPQDPAKLFQLAERLGELSLVG